MKLQLTAGGIDYLSHCLAGGPPPQFCKISLGNGDNAGFEAETLSNPLVDVGITDISREGSFVTLVSRLNNAAVEERFKETEIGVFVSDPDDESGLGVILFAYGYVPDEEAAIIPAAADYAFETVQNLMVYVGATEDVTAILSESQVTATKAELLEHTNDNRNPHNVTAAQVGLGNVENKNINDLTPKIEYYSDYSDIQDGMTMQEILGKLASLSIVYRHHAECENPHGVTPDQIGAAPTKHNHSVNDITSGTLSVARGGTGVNSKEALAAALRKYLNAPYFGVYTGDGSFRREIFVGFTPSAVFVVESTGIMCDGDNNTYGGLAIGDESVQSSAVSITASGFSVAYNINDKVKTNESGKAYRYIAFW